MGYVHRKLSPKHADETELLAQSSHGFVTTLTSVQVLVLDSVAEGSRNRKWEPVRIAVFGPSTWCESDDTNCERLDLLLNRILHDIVEVTAEVIL